jgi:carbonic anhydrase
MAQLVKLEPGDILVLGNIGEALADDEARDRLSRLMRELGVEHVLVFEGDVDLSKVSADAVAGS